MKALERFLYCTAARWKEVLEEGAHVKMITYFGAFGRG
jgi:hypothetical protein